MWSVGATIPGNRPAIRSNAITNRGMSGQRRIAILDDDGNELPAGRRDVQLGAQDRHLSRLGRWARLPRAILSLLNSKVLLEFPTLRLIISHGGGSVPYQVGRWRAARGTPEPEGPDGVLPLRLAFDVRLRPNGRGGLDRLLGHGAPRQVDQASVAIVTLALPRSAFPRVPESSGRQ